MDTEEPGGYERDAGFAFGLFVKPHTHLFRKPMHSYDGKCLQEDEEQRCQHCNRTRGEIAEAKKQ